MSVKELDIGKGILLTRMYKKWRIVLAVAELRPLTMQHRICERMTI